jgi:hypothetical protein
MQNSKQLHFKRKEPKTKDKYMKNKNFGKLKYLMVEHLFHIWEVSQTPSTQFPYLI